MQHHGGRPQNEKPVFYISCAHHLLNIIFLRKPFFGALLFFAACIAACWVGCFGQVCQHFLILEGWGIRGGNSRFRRAPKTAKEIINFGKRMCSFSGSGRLGDFRVAFLAWDSTRGRLSLQESSRNPQRLRSGGSGRGRLSPQESSETKVCRGRGVDALVPKNPQGLRSACEFVRVVLSCRLHCCMLGWLPWKRMHIISYHITSRHIISYRIISYHIR